MDHAAHRGDGRLPAGDRMELASLRARHGDVIARYVNRRTESPYEAAQILEAVFQAAADRHGTLPANALPWLIATARHECAEARRPHPRARPDDTTKVRHLRIA